MDRLQLGKMASRILKSIDSHALRLLPAKARRTGIEDDRTKKAVRDAHISQINAAWRKKSANLTILSPHAGREADVLEFDNVILLQGRL